MCDRSMCHQVLTPIGRLARGRGLITQAVSSRPARSAGVALLIVVIILSMLLIIGVLLLRLI